MVFSNHAIVSTIEAHEVSLQPFLKKFKANAQIVSPPQ
jgi:hypothetical protein